MSDFPSDPEADADSLDDDELLEAYFEGSQNGSVSRTVNVPDWPPCDGSVTLTIDPRTVAWFKAHHRNWRSEIDLVLRAWIMAHAKGAALAAGPQHDTLNGV